MKRLLIVLTIIMLFAACSPGGNAALFTLLPSTETGISFQNDLTESDSLNALTFTNIYHGSGAGIGDFNNDSLPDIFFAANMVSSRLYLNEGSFHFTDVTHSSGLTTNQWINGVAVIDINQDGWKDIYLCVANRGDSSKAGNLLYINRGLNDAGIPQFEEMAAAYGLNNKAYSMQAAFFDYDRDGDLDMYLLNNGVVSAKTNYLIRPKMLNGESETTDCLYRNDGGAEHPHFTDVSAQAGIRAEGFGLGVAISDVNKDGYPDIYVSNDFITNDLLWINNGNGTFTDRNNDYLQHTSLNGMGVDIADVNNDGWYDIIQLDMLPKDNYRRKMMFTKPDYNSFLRQLSFNYQAQFVKNTLQINNGYGPDSAISFSDMAQISGVAATDWSWAPLLADFDNDGWKDLFITNGYRRDITDLDFIVNDYKANNRFGSSEYKKSTYKEQLEKLPEIELSDFIFHNNGDMTFSDNSAKWGVNTSSFSTGAAYADLDNDGDQDLVVNTIDGPVMIYKNNVVSTGSVSKDQRNNFLEIYLKGDSLNMQGIGASVCASVAGKAIWQEHYLSRGYLSSVDDKIIIGIGDTQSADSVTITWPDSRKQVIYKVDANKKIRFDYAKADVILKVTAPAKKQWLSNITRSSGIDYVHMEEEYIDFNHNALIPYKASQNGPCLATGDVNGDGLEDVFIGGSNAQQRQILYQQADGKFTHTILPVGECYEDVDALLFDADNDKDLDLYVVSGSTEYPSGSKHYQDRLYINTGNGKFEERNELLPAEYYSGSCIAAADYDGDGDADLFIGGRSVPGKYPFAEKSMLLRNDSGYFVDVTVDDAKQLLSTGMVNDALWADMDGDGDPDLVTAGEFSSVELYINEKGRLKKQEAGDGLSLSGWWTSIAAADMDGDGDIDLVAGNLGNNTHYHASPSAPLSIYAMDYDMNGSIDPVIGVYLPDQKGVPVLFSEAPRDQLAQQFPSIRKKFERYDSFASATLEDILRPGIHSCYQRSIVTLSSTYFENVGKGGFKAIPLPAGAQTAPVHQILITDIDGDKRPDIIAGGNDYSWDSRNGYSDASHGYVLQGDGKGKFRALPFSESGFFVKGDVRSIRRYIGADGSSCFLVGCNRAALIVYQSSRTAHLPE